MPGGGLVDALSTPIALSAAVGGHLTSDRRGGTLEPPGDGGQRVAGADADEDLFAISDAQAPRPGFPRGSTWSGIVYVALITDVFSRRIVGWKAARTMQASLVVDALNMAAWTRRDRYR